MKIPGPIPNHILERMNPEDRPLGIAGFTKSEMKDLMEKKNEKAMHDLFSQWLRLNGIPYIHARMDKKSTIQKGWPDFTMLYQGRALCVEFKAMGGAPSEEQESVIQSLTKTGTTVLVCWLVSAAILETREFFNIP
jgi:hypothetical protein